MHINAAISDCHLSQPKKRNVKVPETYIYNTSLNILELNFPLPIAIYLCNGLSPVLVSMTGMPREIPW